MKVVKQLNLFDEVDLYDFKGGKCIVSKTQTELTTASRAKFIANGGIIKNGIRINPEIVPIYEELRKSYSSDRELLQVLLLNHYNRFMI